MCIRRGGEYPILGERAGGEQGVWEVNGNVHGDAPCIALGMDLPIFYVFSLPNIIPSFIQHTVIFCDIPLASCDSFVIFPLLK